jgi:hypothetical protein
MADIARFPQVRISLRESPVLLTERPAMTLQTSRGANQATPVVEGLTMAHAANNAPDDSAQPAFTDPLISAARFVNEAAALDRALAMRKALRPQRSQAALKGWEARRG